MPNPLTDAEAAELRRLCESPDLSPPDDFAARDLDADRAFPTWADCRFVELARTAFPRLLAEREALRRVVEAVQPTQAAPRFVDCGPKMLAALDQLDRALAALARPAQDPEG